MFTTRRLFVAIALLLFLSSCGSSSGEVSSDSVAAASDESTDASTTTPSADAGSEGAGSSGDSTSEGDSDEAKTLDEYLGGAANFARGGQGGGGFGGGDNADQRLEEQRQIEQAVQICMKAQGFEYTPAEVGTGLQFVLADQRAGISPEEFAQTEGFGISTRFDAVLEGEVEIDTDSTPNEEYVASLSEGEADAYELALRGAPPVRNDQGQAIDPDTGEVLQGGRGARVGGCRSSAQDQVRGDFSALADLADDFADLADRIASDPQIVAFNTSWVSCMQESGFTYDDEAEARQEIEQAFQPLLRSFFASANDGQEQTAGQQGQRGQGNRLAAVAGLTLTAEQEAELVQLQDLERSVATASLGCQAGTAEQIAEITAGYEADFVAQNRDILESLG